jgi:cobalt-zinc-cadmium efflux system outer membrane protein
VEVPRKNSVTLSLAGATWLAFGRNPGLAALRREIDQKTGLLLQADTVPNPRLTIAPQMPLGDGILVDGTLEVSQVLEFGKRSARADSAVSAQEVAKALYFLRRNELLLKVKEAFVECLSAVAVETLQIDLVDFFEKVYRLEVDLFRGGRVGEEAEIRAGIRLERARIALHSARRALLVAHRTLEMLCALGPYSLRGVKGILAMPAELPPEARLQVAVIRDNPFLLSLDRKRGLAKSRLLQAQMKPIPDVQAGLRYTRRRGEGRDSHVIGLSLSLPIPLWDQNAGNAQAWREAIAVLLEERKEGENELLLRLSREVHSHHENLRSLRDFDEKILPRLEKALSLAVMEREAGRSSYRDVLLAQAELASGRIERLAFIRACLIARAAVELLMGSTLSRPEGREE